MSLDLDNMELGDLRDMGLSVARAAGLGLGLAWIGVLAVAIPISLTLGVVMPTKKVEMKKGSLTAGEVYDRWAQPDDGSKRFKLADILYRFSII